jgi:hypothetical protein
MIVQKTLTSTLILVTSLATSSCATVEYEPPVPESIEESTWEDFWEGLLTTCKPLGETIICKTVRHRGPS